MRSRTPAPRRAPKVHRCSPAKPAVRGRRTLPRRRDRRRPVERAGAAQRERAAPDRHARRSGTGRRPALSRRGAAATAPGPDKPALVVRTDVTDRRRWTGSRAGPLRAGRGRRRPRGAPRRRLRRRKPAVEAGSARAPARLHTQRRQAQGGLRAGRDAADGRATRDRYGRAARRADGGARAPRRGRPGLCGERPGSRVGGGLHARADGRRARGYEPTKRCSRSATSLDQG